MNDIPDMHIPGFDIDGEIGQGAMASVYLATQRSLQRKVALKVMAASLAADPSFCERFLREGRTLARLGHPNLARPEGHIVPKSTVVWFGVRSASLWGVKQLLDSHSTSGGERTSETSCTTLEI